MNIALTVIMPSLNVADYIEKSLQTVISQTLDNIEILCIDAGSTDGTREIIAEYAKKDSRISLMDSKVKSYGYQVNMGIQLAHGEYIAILETDDYIALDMYGILYKSAREYDLDIVKSDFFYHITKGQKCYSTASHINSFVDIEYSKVYQLDDIPMMMLYDANIWKGIYKKSFILDNRIELNNSKGAAYQDIGFLIQVAYANPRVMYIEDALYYYRYEREGSSGLNSNVLGYIEDEWSFLQKRGLLNESCGITSYALARLIICFIYEYNKLLRLYNDIVDFDTINACFVRLRENIADAITNCPSVADIIDSEKVFDVFEHNEEYVATRQAINYKYDDGIGKIKALFEKKPVIVFGCGSYGRRVRRILFDCDVNQTCFCDNNSDLWESAIDGITVINPVEALRGFHGIIVVASKYHFSEIVSGIRSCAEEDIIIFDASSIFEMIDSEDSMQTILR